MFVSFDDVFNPTPEQIKQRLTMLNKTLKMNYERIGKDCANCKQGLYVQQSPYYDYLTCKLDNSVELSGGLDERHCCDKYEFAGYFEVE